ncbi:MAG: hypothetical protein A2Y00_10390 [Omnitrophica WOR_2 bacterium GWF2_43_52]|nr:MAG: hypothetical protein A2062_02665 [Omnitrophica WOR_2 bacterium GWA2_44_7]OGX21875.1 MAG: hypothetical protein A2Y00_10390 [Omnitrophica WOR_2 bacterium GWF2_43_52]OGX58827.1 MAG: hypothetical protein A2460_04475 [Omnitrophica WOR_2 bacterium RIFOXYC2_FULL_43_9]HAH20188.1 two-component system response regulator [Candidatus Omnitrophota bacterium]HBG63032.1 two-component system response regulator [Candidatus Omnitrophota bacterium]
MADESKKIKILLVDDEKDILIETKEIFEKRGFLVFTAAESDSALSIFQKERPRICLLDVHMPQSRLDGIGILEEIRKIDKTSYCIMLSRVDDEKRIDEAKRLGANRYVLKPLDFTELLQLVNEAAKEAAR